MTPAAPATAAIGIVAALALEAAPARRQPGLTVRLCGIAAPGAGDVVAELAALGCRLIVSWGTAGALSPRRRAGDLVVPARVLAANGRALATDDTARAAFHRALRGALTVSSGDMAETDRILATPGDKYRLGRASAADAVDMESGCIGSACAALNLPFLVIRAVVDELDDRLPRQLGAGLFDDGSRRRGALLADLLRHPRDVAALARLGWRYRHARTSLAVAARALAQCRPGHS